MDIEMNKMEWKSEFTYSNYPFYKLYINRTCYSSGLGGSTNPAAFNASFSSSVDSSTFEVSKFPGQSFWKLSTW